MFAKTPEDKEKLGGEYFGKQLPNFLGTSETLLKKHGGKYFVGDNLTWADIAVMYILDVIMNEKSMTDIPGQENRKEILTKFPLLNGLRQRVHEQKGIKKWIETRPENKF